MRKLTTFLAATPAAIALFTASAAGHIVQPGESLWSIAQANGMSVASLAAANGLSAESQLIAGTTINVAGSTATTTQTAATTGGGRVVQPGESLWSIAQANGISIGTL